MRTSGLVSTSPSALSANWRSLSSRLNILQAVRRWEDVGVFLNIIHGYVWKGHELRTASTSTIAIRSLSYLSLDWPTILPKEHFVDRMRCSNHTPHYGALDRLNTQLMPRPVMYHWISSWVAIKWNIFPAPFKVFPLSETMSVEALWEWWPSSSTLWIVMQRCLETGEDEWLVTQQVYKKIQTLLTSHSHFWCRVVLQNKLHHKWMLVHCLPRKGALVEY